MFSRLTPDHRVYAPPVHGLIGKVFRDLGHQVTMLTTALPDGTVGVRETDHATVHYLADTTPSKLDAAFWSASARAFDASHAKNPFDIVFGRGESTWGFHSQSGATGQLPVIAHEGTYPHWLHQLERRMPGASGALTAPIALLRAPLKSVYRACLQRASITVCNSPALANALQRIYWWNPPCTAFIPYGFELDHWPALDNVNNKGAAPQGPPRIVFVGRMTPDKGVFDMVEVLSRLRHPTAVMEAIGPIADNVKRKLTLMLAERGLSDRFHILGPERNEDIPKRLQGAAAFIFLSTHPEGLSKSVMEAMAASLPVTAYRIPGMDTLVTHGETGWLLTPGDVVGAADRLSQFLEKPQLAHRMGQSGRQRIADHFTPEAATARWADLLNEIRSRSG